MESLHSEELNDRPLVVFSGGANRPLAEEIVRCLGVPLGRATIGSFPDTETQVILKENVRGADVFVVQSTCQPVNESTMELLIIIDALRRDSAARITGVIPYMGYSRQDRKATGREPISAKLVANLLMAAGMDRAIAVDLHNAAIQGFYDEPLDHLTAVPALSEALTEASLPDPVLVSPDVGRAKMVEQFQKGWNVPMVLMHKRRTGQSVEVAEIVGDVKGKTAVIVDDIIAGGSILTHVDALVKAGARPEVVLAITHPVLVGNALSRIEEHPALKTLITTDTISIPNTSESSKIKVVTLAPMLAEVIWRIHTNQSVSEVYKRQFESFPV